MKRSMKNTCRTRVESEVSKEHVLKPQQTRYTRRKATASSPPKVTPGDSRTTLHRDTEKHAGNLNPDSFNFIIFAPSIGEHPSSILEISSNRGATTHTIKASISFFRSPHPPSTPEPFTRRTMKNTCRTRVESEVSKEHVLKPQQTRYTRRKATASSPPKVTPGDSRTTLHRDTEKHAGNLNPDSFNFIIFAPSIGEHPSSILEISSNRGATTHTIKASISFFRSPHPPSTPEPFTRRTSLESVSRLIRRHQATTYRNLERFL
ncbi:hypothetical protein DY000_02008824 [Brassica cretica]|uniref:Uncharacterized protein n=1 Tax=Brassica cretica TaxID=69181 RepID=A0ABQ7BZZ5_BRACR|nr:hypothetical protein DY000_02008824 [Brassica cretica]